MVDEVDSILVVAFDGLDKRFVEKYGLNNIQQEEFGSIENSEDVEKIMTPELFASFVTGKPTEEHGIRDRGKWNKEFLNKYESVLNPLNLLSMKRFFKVFPSVSQDGVTLEDHEHETLFEKFEKSKSLFVPTVSPSVTQKVNWEHATAVRNPALDMDEALEFIEREFVWRKKVLMEELDRQHNFLMCHIFYPDHIQHHFQDWEMSEERKKSLYEEMDEFAGEILEKADLNYDCIIFMSDHGFASKDGEGHNQHAFYSSNVELFPDKEPKITDFFGRLTELGKTDKITSELDI
ncbi:MAG: alkaline phosphatase family protein [Candidatus Nanohalobium sp.]